MTFSGLLALVYRRFAHPISSVFLISALLGILLLCIRATGVFQPAELALYDWNLRMRTSVGVPRVPTVIVAITEEDIQQQGTYPITDESLANLLEMIQSYQPRSIGLDIYRDIAVPPGNQHLKEVLLDNPNIIGVMKVAGGRTGGINPPPSLLGTDQVGFTDIIVDPDGIVRRGLLYQEGEHAPLPSLSLQLAFLYLKKESIFPKPDPYYPEHLRLGQSTLIPYQKEMGGYINVDDRGYQVFLDYLEGNDSVPQYSLRDLKEGRISRSDLQDKIVIVGVVADSVPDLFHLPVKKFASGAEVHAAMANQLVRAAMGKYSPITPLGIEWEWAVVLAATILGGGIGCWVKSLWKYMVVNVVFICGLLIFGILLFSQGHWIPEVSMAVGFMVSSAALVAFELGREGEERRVLEQLFFRFVSPEVAQSLWDQRNQFLDGGRPRSQKMTATVLFMDLQGYSSAAEHMDPSQLMDWVNSYLDEMATCIIRHGGVIDDYAGDGIKANFGIPVPRRSEFAIQQEAESAVRCALNMVEKFLHMNQVHEEQGLPSVGLRIGIATGSVVAGSIGSAQRLKYTTVGDTVNVASRLESLSNDQAPLSHTLRYRILLDQVSYRYLSPGWSVQEIGEVVVKGRKEPVTVIQLFSQVERVGSLNLNT